MWNDTLYWVSDNIGVVSAATLLVVCVGSVLGVAAYDRRASIKAYWEHRRTIRIQRGLVMGRKKKAERQAYIKGMLADIVTDGFEEAWHLGKVTRDEANAIYRAIGKTHGIPDLLPHMTPEMLKSAIKGRRERGSGSPAQEKPAWGDSTATAAPAAPASDGNVIQAARRFGQKALAKLKKTA